MKNLFIIFAFILAAIYGCKKEENVYPPPSIKLMTGDGYVSNDTTLQLGEMFKIGIKAENPNVNLTNFIIRVESDEIETYLDSGMNTPVLNYEKTPVKGIKSSEKWVFIIRDKNGKSAEISLNIQKDTASAYGDIFYNPSVLLGAQSNAAGSFYSVSEDSVYTLQSAFNNQDKIDLCYYYDFIETDENTIASPGANIDESVYPGENGLANWTVRRTTRFKLTDLTDSDFQNATNDSLLIAAYGQSEGKRKAKNLQAGNIFSFKNEDGKVGLFMVHSVSGTDEGTVDISIKVQE
ncbi:MAG: hypothetical protein V2I62_01360 [Bacteroidales bacterium]|jgi:hypothetical protein|nr:hypothetical protein [Bacteroidales bacterium]